MSELLENPPSTHHASALLALPALERGGGRCQAPAAGCRFTASAGCVAREPPAARCRRDDTRGPPGWLGPPGSASRCWGSHTSTPHAARSETSCTKEREEEDIEDTPIKRRSHQNAGSVHEVWVCLQFCTANKLQRDSRWCCWPRDVLWLSARLLGMPRDGKTQPPSTGRSHPARDPVYWSSLVV